MKKIIEFIKDKSYYFLGATLLIIVLLLILSSCSSKKASSYEQIENNMITATKKYYEQNKSKLPKENNNSVMVNISTLVEQGLMKEVYGPKNKENKCSGYVEVTKVDNSYVYTPFLTCKGSYEPRYLTDIIKESKLDEYGNGVYTMDGQYVYRGDDVKNYVKFNDQLWRILKVNKDGNIDLLLDDYLEDKYSFDESYNTDTDDTDGVTTNYMLTKIHKVLEGYYKTNFKEDSKSKMTTKTLCTSGVLEEDNINYQKECEKTLENQKIGLLTVSEYANASLDGACLKTISKECMNRNYISNYDKTFWLLTPNSLYTNKVYLVYKYISDTKAYRNNAVKPVIYLNSKNVVSSGDGSLDKPYILK